MPAVRYCLLAWLLLKSHYDRRPVGQCVLVSSPIWGSWPNINYCVTVTVLSISGAPSDERSGLSFDLVTWSASVQCSKFARQRPVKDNEVVFFLWPVLRLYNGGLPHREWSPLLFTFRMVPRKRKSIGQANPKCKRMKLLRAAETLNSDKRA
jgi:hypothetical protein